MAKVKIQIQKTETEMQIPSKTFKSGKQGFWGQAKVQTEDGKRYQVQVQAVEIAK